MRARRYFSDAGEVLLSPARRLFAVASMSASISWRTAPAEFCLPRRVAFKASSRTSSEAVEGFVERFMPAVGELEEKQKTPLPSKKAERGERDGRWNYFCSS
jgi:hypothetical protein